MRRSILALAALGGALLPTATYADAAYDQVVRNGPYDGTARYEPRWTVPVNSLPGGCLGETRGGTIFVRDGTVAPNSLGDMVRCTRDPSQR